MKWSQKGEYKGVAAKVEAQGLIPECIIVARTETDLKRLSNYFRMFKDAPQFNKPVIVKEDK